MDTWHHHQSFLWATPLKGAAIHGELTFKIFHHTHTYSITHTAMSSPGEWHIILQTDKIHQRVAIDMCHHPNKACPGLSDCGKKSRCVQRYNYQVGKSWFFTRLDNSFNFFQLLLSLPASTSHTPLCPSIRAFKFPSGCVCHAETKSEQDLVSDIDSHQHNSHQVF